jgi:hypothetical protein
MRRSWNVIRSRATPILTGAVVAILVLPATALAGGFSAPNGLHHRGATGSGGAAGLVIFLGVLAAAVLALAVLSRAGAERKTAQRQPERIHRRKPARTAS